MRRVTRHLVPFLMFCYFINFLDRVNVGFAALQMNGDLKLNSAAFGFGAGLFFVGYFIFEVPSNLMLYKFGARRWIARIIFTWGLCATGMAFIQGENSFYHRALSARRGGSRLPARDILFSDAVVSGGLSRTGSRDVFRSHSNQRNDRVADLGDAVIAGRIGGSARLAVALSHRRDACPAARARGRILSSGSRFRRKKMAGQRISASGLSLACRPNSNSVSKSANIRYCRR